MKKKLFIAFNALAISSFLLYIIFYNGITNLVRHSLGLNKQPNVFVSYCKTGLPSAISPTLLLVGILVTVAKFSLYLISLNQLQKKPLDNIKTICSSMLVCFTFIEILSVIAFRLDKIFESQLFKYFASTLHFFNLGIQLKKLEIVLALNCAFSLLFAYLFLKASNQLHTRKIFELFTYTILSIVLLVVLKKLVF